MPASTKRVLIEQAGGKCANPGCSNKLVELHHIREWHVYHTHDADHMIAICPACHDCVDRGQLQISDEELYRWKGIDRAHTPTTAHIFIEPGEAPKLLLGSVSALGTSGLVVFDISGRHRLSFAVRDGDIMLLNVKISTPTGRPLLDVVDGYVRRRDSSIELKTRPGAVEIPAGLFSRFVPEWVRTCLMREDPDYGIRHRMPLLSLNIVDRGLVRVEGLWLDEDRGVVITRDSLSFVQRSVPRPVTIKGQGELTVLNFVGALGMSLFAFQSDGPTEGALKL